LSLSREDSRICPVADRYWNARGGSHTDGGSFIFNLERNAAGKMRLTCADKFGVPVQLPEGNEVSNLSEEIRLSSPGMTDIENSIRQLFDAGSGLVFEYMVNNMPAWSFAEVRSACETVRSLAKDPAKTVTAIEVLTLLNDRRYATGTKKRKHILQIVREALHQLFSGLPGFNEPVVSEYRLIDYASRGLLREPLEGETTLVINAKDFPPEGNDCDASLLMDAYFKGWLRFISFYCAGQRFIGCGLGPQTDGVTIDVYDSSGDYLGSGIDGLTVTVHGNAQDQLGQVTKSGKLVIHGDTGQTFLYGAKGGSIYVMGNAAGRPLINSVGRPRVIINGTCLDFLAESFMAGDVLNGGGFVILNGVTFDDQGRLVPLPEPYPGSNLFSMASGGALYIRDPLRQVIKEQLNGGQFLPLTGDDWDIILPYLQENERLFGIRVEDLLTVDGARRAPAEIYRKVAPVRLAALSSKKVESNGESEQLADE
jgi:hypothetical protein